MLLYLLIDYLAAELTAIIHVSEASVHSLSLLLWKLSYLTLMAHSVILILYTIMPSEKCFKRFNICFPFWNILKVATHTQIYIYMYIYNLTIIQMSYYR